MDTVAATIIGSSSSSNSINSVNIIVTTASACGNKNIAYMF